VFILHVFWEVTREIVGHRVDGVEQEHIEAAQEAAAAVPGVLDDRVRGGWMGRSLTLEFEGQLPADTSLAQAQETGRVVENAVREAVEDVRHVQWIPRA
jgi:divalent metal cation (Fe/Co/Zn/Cd) transporter